MPAPARRARPAWRLIAAGSSLAVLLAAASALSATPRVNVAVPAALSTAGKVTISFHPARALPGGGYYYAVAVLVDYRRAPGEAPVPPCAISSDMGVTQYGFPRHGRPVHLTLIAAPSGEGRWCAGGSYEGAVYAVPHGPPCSKAYPCHGKSAEYSSCWRIEEHVVCGVVALPPPYSYPGGLPKPVDRSARIIARFGLSFPSA
jgi:hypothetical protein